MSSSVLSNVHRAPGYPARARFSASDRPTAPAFDYAAYVADRRASDGTLAMIREWSAPLARWFESFVARLAGVRRAATMALTLMLVTGMGDRSGDGAIEGAEA